MSFSFSWTVIPPAVPAPGTAPGDLAGETARRDMALDQVTGDIYTDGTGDLVFDSGIEGIVSDLRARFGTFKGEWFLDLLLGFPWMQDVLGQKYDPAVVRADIVAIALGTPGVTSCDVSPLSFKNRTLTAKFTCSTDLGTMIEIVLSNTGA